MQLFNIHKRGRAWRSLIGLVGLSALLIGCRGNETSTAAPPAPTAAAQATASSPPTIEPTATEVPLAARVNGQPITLESLQRETARFEAGWIALGRDLADAGEYRTRVLDDLINQELVLQAAARDGQQTSDEEVESQYQTAVTAAGGQEAFDAWLASAQYTPEEFRQQLRVAATAQALSASVVVIPDTAEEVHARHILVSTANEAESIVAQAQAGVDFGELARRYSRDLSTRINGGELGWFARGQLAVPEVEDVAFNLQPNEISGVVQSSLGYHVVQTLERDPARKLDLTTLAARRQQAFDEWLATERAGASIELLSN